MRWSSGCGTVGRSPDNLRSGGFHFFLELRLAVAAKGVDEGVAQPASHPARNIAPRDFLRLLSIREQATRKRRHRVRTVRADKRHRLERASSTVAGRPGCLPNHSSERIAIDRRLHLHISISGDQANLVRRIELRHEVGLTLQERSAETRPARASASIRRSRPRNSFMRLALLRFVRRRS